MENHLLGKSKTFFLFNINPVFKVSLNSDIPLTLLIVLSD